MRPAAEGFVAHEGHGLVGREVMAVIIENREMKGLNGTVGGVGGDHVDLVRVESAVEETEVHGARVSIEAEAVGGFEAVKTVGTLLEFVTDTETHLRREGRGLAEGSDMEALGVVRANDHGERVVETKGWSGGDLVALLVEAADGCEDAVGVAVGGIGQGLLEDGGEGGAGVLDVGVEASGEHGLLANVTAGEVKAALDGEMGFDFDFLGKEFAQDDLLGEVFCADDGVVGAGRGTGGDPKGDCDGDGDE